MAKIKSPLRFSRYYGVAPSHMARLGVFDPTLQVDTKLFIDPVLIRHSAAVELSQAGSARVTTFFTQLYRLLAASRREGDVAWDAARQRLHFHEQSGTCLGYGGGSISGSGWGPHLTDQLLRRAKEIIDAGVADPELFLLIGLFSENVGPDRLSDMVTNIVLPDLAAYTARICDTLGIPREPFILAGTQYELPVNPEQLRRRTPVILIPSDVLRDLPVAFSVEDIWTAAAQNDVIRSRISGEVGVTWRRASQETKSNVLRALLHDPAYARELIQRVLSIQAPEYDQSRDPRALLLWSDLAYTLAEAYPMEVVRPAVHTVESLDSVVVAIIEQFKFLIEQRDQWRILQEAPTRKTEKTAQTLFFAVAYAYCQANRLDVTPEADTGNGPVDFKFSTGASPKILVELKLSKNNIQHGHDVQLPIYVAAEGANRAHYVVIDVGGMGRKWMNLQAARALTGTTEPRLWLVDSSRRAAASTRRPSLAPDVVPFHVEE